MDTQLVPDGGVYQLLLVLHLVTVIGGFGSILLNGLYGEAEATRRHGGSSGGQGPSVSEWLIYVVPVTGLLLVLVSEDRWQFSQAWISLSFLLYLAAVGVMHAGRKLQPAARSAVLNLLVVAVVALMVIKPGA